MNLKHTFEMANFEARMMMGMSNRKNTWLLDYFYTVLSCPNLNTNFAELEFFVHKSINLSTTVSFKRW